MTWTSNKMLMFIIYANTCRELIGYQIMNEFNIVTLPNQMNTKLNSWPCSYFCLARFGSQPAPISPFINRSGALGLAWLNTKIAKPKFFILT